MNHKLWITGEVYRHADDGYIPVYTSDGWYEYDVHEGDTVIINDGSTSSVYIIKGACKCKECPIRSHKNLCAIAVKCRVTGMFKSVCRAKFGVHSIDEIMENL